MDFATKSRFPAMYGSSEVVDVGGLMSYAATSPTYFDVPPSMSTEFSRVLSLPNCRSSSRPSSS